MKVMCDLIVCFQANVGCHVSCKVVSLLLGDIERCLGSEGEDEGSVWGMDALDSRDVQDKISLTASESPELGSPAGCVSPPRESWRDIQTTDSKDPERTEHGMFGTFFCRGIGRFRPSCKRKITRIILDLHFEC